MFDSENLRWSCASAAVPTKELVPNLLRSPDDKGQCTWIIQKMWFLQPNLFLWLRSFDRTQNGAGKEPFARKGSDQGLQSVLLWTRLLRAAEHGRRSEPPIQFLQQGEQRGQVHFEWPVRYGRCDVPKILRISWGFLGSLSASFHLQSVGQCTSH